MRCASRNAIASSRMSRQRSRSGASSGNASRGAYGLACTREHAYITTLSGAMNVEWSVIWRHGRRRTRPRRCTYTAGITNNAKMRYLTCTARSGRYRKHATWARNRGVTRRGGELRGWSARTRGGSRGQGCGVARFEHCAHRRAAQRFAEIVSLPLVASLQREPLQLRFGFDAFGGGLEPEIVGETDDGANDRGRIRIAADVADEGLVDLDLVYRERAQRTLR